MARVLITDDTDDIRSLFVLALEGQGYEVTQARDGNEALEILSRQPHDLMLLDLHMPNLNGFQVLEALSARLASTGQRPPPVIVLTADNDWVSLAKARGLGAARTLVKSHVDLDQLYAEVDRVLIRSTSPET